MGKKSRQAPQPVHAVSTDRWRTFAPAILLAVTLACYWTPMTSSGTTILWDAADYFQPIQNYLSQELHAGRIPFWTPFPWAGFPFLADPQAGAWYLPNWPFFLLGVTPRVLMAEQFAHALLACFGAYLLAFRMTGSRPGSILAGLCYGLSGFFSGHSSHTVMVQCAAWLPWLLLLFDRGLTGRPLMYAGLGGIVSGLIILAGHFQTALYSFFALSLFGAARLISRPSQWRRIFALGFAMPVLGALLSAISTGPGIELARNSIRTTLVALNHLEGMIPPRALLTLFFPNYYGALSGTYTGPPDITQYYFYAGILLVPLALFGAIRNSSRLPGLILFVAAAWFAMGPSAGLYRLIASLPGFQSVRAPVNIWFVPALGLALLAAAGAAAFIDRWRVKWLGAMLLAIVSADLFYWNWANNSLAYGRTAHEAIYGPGENLLRRAVAVHLPPLMRFDAPEHLPTFGPLAHYLDLRIETTYGYDPLMLSRYSDYFDAMKVNSKLRNGLNVALWLDNQAGAIRANPDALPRVSFPKALVATHSDDEGRRLLRTLDPARQALIPAAIGVPAQQDGNGAARVTEYTPGHYRIHYRCASRSLLLVSNAYFNGWAARSGGARLVVAPADRALIGIMAPAGEGDIDLDYHSTYFAVGATVSLAALGLCAALITIGRRTQIKQAPKSSTAGGF